jgi:hypothetical protein
MLSRGKGSQPVFLGFGGAAKYFEHTTHRNFGDLRLRGILSIDL